MNDPRDYAGEPVCTIGLACTVEWPDCVAFSESIGTSWAEACKITCQVYNWVDCDACDKLLREVAGV